MTIILTGDNNDNVLNAGATDDYALYGLGGNDTLNGNSKNDRLDGGTGADRMNGGAGNDVFIVDNSGDVVTDSSGTDRVESSITYALGASIENLTLTGLANIAGTGNGLNNFLVGNSGDNTLNGGVGTDVMAGGDGNDSYYVDVAADVVSEAHVSGTDTVFSRATTFTLGANLEHLDLLNTALIPRPGGGYDVLPGGVDGTGNSLVNRIEGNSGVNVLRGMGGHDTIYGEGGDDTLDGGTATDDLYGGTGDDHYIVDAFEDNIFELADAGIDSVSASCTYRLDGLDANVENLTLTGTGDFNGTGNLLGNVMIGNSGNNYLNGGGGADTMSGGLGDDKYVLEDAGDVVIEGAGEGTDTILSGYSYTLSDPNIENLRLFGTAAINATGNAGNNEIEGADGDNVLMGLAGNDVLRGGYLGNDTLQGGTGADDLHAGRDMDTLRAVDNVGSADDGATDRFFFSFVPSASDVNLIDQANFTAAGGEGSDDEIVLNSNVLDNNNFTALLSTAGTRVGTLSAAHYHEGSSNGDGVFDPIGIYNNTATGELFYNPTYGTGGDSKLFVVINLVGVPGGSAVLSAEEFTLG